MEEAGPSGPRGPGVRARAEAGAGAGRSLLVARDTETCRFDDMRIKSLYRRVMTRWVVDVMELRRRGLDVPGGPARNGGTKRRRRVRMDA